MMGLGRTHNVITAAAGIDIPLRRYGAIEFYSFEDDGSTIMTVQEVDSTGTNGDQNLDVDFEPHKCPGVGGAWTAMAEQDDTVDLADDTTNDTLFIVVHATQLSDGYDSVKVTVDGGILIAVLIDLAVQRAPANLKSSIVA